ncbi:MAG: ankyrin repeat domain-containing protein [Fimbriimonadaceae bacterium]|nr:ankyrin repeat domain-containing protein [Fimbriimonadaceae bacterium]
MEDLFSLLAQGGEQRVVELLAADPTLAWSVAPAGQPLVLAAAQQRCFQVLAALQRCQFDLDALLPNGLTPLQQAARQGDRPAAQALITAGASLDLFSAMALGAEEHVQTHTAANRLTLEERDGQGATLLHWAVEANRVELAQALLQRGAAIDAVDAVDEVPLRRLLRWDSASRCGEMAELLVAHGATVDAVLAAALGLNEPLTAALDAEPARLRLVEHGRTLLHWAVEADSVACVQLLLDRGAALEARSAAGETPLLTAALRRCQRVWPLLRERGADLGKCLPDGREARALARQAGLPV